MRIELKNFVIESDKELEYINELVNHIIVNENRILTFFDLDKLPNKVTIKIMSYESFKEFIISKYGEILEYVSGDSDSPTHTIRLLNIEDQRQYTIHKNADIEKLKGTVLHEIIHQCHHTFHMDYKHITWFAEGLATNLSNQNYKVVSLEECDFEKLKYDFRHYKGSYVFSYTIVNYVLNNYPKEEIIKLCSNPDYLREKANIIFEEAKSWIKEPIKN